MHWLPCRFHDTFGAVDRDIAIGYRGHLHQCYGIQHPNFEVWSACLQCKLPVESLQATPLPSPNHHPTTTPLPLFALTCLGSVIGMASTSVCMVITICFRQWEVADRSISGIRNGVHRLSPLCSDRFGLKLPDSPCGWPVLPTRWFQARELGLNDCFCSMMYTTKILGVTKN